MTLVGLIVALLAGVWLLSPWSPISRPAGNPGGPTPASRPAQTIDRVREAVGEIEARQKQQEDRIRQLP
jgi:hypothetical protein